MENLLKNLVGIARLAGTVPIGDVAFLKATDPDFANGLDRSTRKILRVCSEFLNEECEEDQVFGFEDVDDAADQLPRITEAVDNILEKSDTMIDEMFRQAKPKTDIVVTNFELNSKTDVNVIHQKNLIRPQLNFKDKIDNSNSTPFFRKIKEKPNALIPLMEDEVNENNLSVAYNQEYHPYEYEIDHLKHPSHMFDQKTPEQFGPLQNSLVNWIDTPESLDALVRNLSKEKAIAVDLEHHNYRSYQGFTCLIQISTRQKDYIIDALALRSHLHALNLVFTDPKITKVLHGAESDIVWLQKDFGVYIVNLFDTYHAAVALEMSGRGYAHLLKHYCSISTDKKHQLADWRMRPIPTDMLRYAQMDTHYLLYIYDCMRIELLRSDKMQRVLERSAQTAKRVYTKIPYPQDGDGPIGWKNLLLKYKGNLRYEQLEVFKALHQWRDFTAREEDESLGFVMPNYLLFRLAEQLPKDPGALLSQCNPPPTLVTMNAPELARLIQRTLVEAEVSRAEKEKEMERVMSEIKEKEMAIEERKKRRHSRFSDAGQSVEDLTNTFDVVVKQASTSLWTQLADEETKENAKVFESVKSAITFDPPSVKQVKEIIIQSPPSAPAESIPEPQIEEKSDENLTEEADIMRQVEPDVVKISSSATRKRKKNKRKSSSAPGSPVEKFDYEGKKSEITASLEKHREVQLEKQKQFDQQWRKEHDEEEYGVVVDEDEESEIQEKREPGKSAQFKKRKVFDPYSQLDEQEQFKKNAPKSKAWRKSGNRTINWKS